MKLIKPAILKKVIIGIRPFDEIKKEDKVVKLFVELGEDEERLYEFIQSYDSINKWVEEYLKDKLNLDNEEDTKEFICTLLNNLIQYDYYKPYYNKKIIDKVLKENLKIILKSINKDIIEYSEKDRKFVLIQSEKDLKLNKDKYPELVEKFTSIKGNNEKKDIGDNKAEK